tara:strand:+ start:265 stop:531 length:267 start_codon:yes stop_codon:yes gene_type:complete
MKKIRTEIEKFLEKKPKIKNTKKEIKIEKSIPKNLRNGIDKIEIKTNTLTIKTKNPSWRQEIMFLKKEILEKINKKFPNYGIDKIIIL